MQGLGYERYGAHGGDFGAGVATYMALSQPDRVAGIHLSTPELSPYMGPGAPPLSVEERSYLDHVARWEETERGYSAVQSTRPQTLGYGLNDSPAGLAAWVLDKWRSWSDSGGDHRVADLQATEILVSMVSRRLSHCGSQEHDRCRRAHGEGKHDPIHLE